MLPSTLLRLAAWPLLSNGKLDRKALPPPDLATPRADYEPASSLIEEVLVRIWSELLGVKTIGVHDDFFELGGHSLLAIRLLAEIEKALGLVLRVFMLFQAPTIRKLAAVIQQQGVGPVSCIVAVQPHGTRPRLFAAGYGGGIATFKALARELGMDQPLCVLDTGVFGDEKDDFTLEELARKMVADMRELQPTGPYHLVGYSLGGKIVYEMAQQLGRTGQELALLALLDCSGPGYPKRASFVVRVWLHLRHGLAMGPAQAWRYLAERVWNLRKYVVRIRPKLFGEAEASMPPAKAMQQAADALDRAWARDPADLLPRPGAAGPRRRPTIVPRRDRRRPRNGLGSPGRWRRAAGESAVRARPDAEPRKRTRAGVAAGEAPCASRGATGTHS